jgi:hypothetical protein
MLDSIQTSTKRGCVQAASIEWTETFPTLPGTLVPPIQDDRAIRKFRPRQKVQAKAALLPQLAAKADERGISLFAYLAELAPEDVGASRFLSLE